MVDAPPPPLKPVRQSYSVPLPPGTPWAALHFVFWLMGGVGGAWAAARTHIHTLDDGSGGHCALQCGTSRQLQAEENTFAELMRGDCTLLVMRTRYDPLVQMARAEHELAHTSAVPRGLRALQTGPIGHAISWKSLTRRWRPKVLRRQEPLRLGGAGLGLFHCIVTACPTLP